MATIFYDGSGNPITVETDDGTYTENITITIGASGDFNTLNEAFEEITKKYPAYKKGGLAINIKILFVMLNYRI